jgi:Tol biopolymer transport system component
LIPARPLSFDPGLAKRMWLALACSLVAVGITAAACGGEEEEVFTGEPTGTIAFVTNRDGNDEIYLMNGDGSEQVNISNNEAADSEPWWSPDGSRLAFSSFRTGLANLFTMKADGSDVRQLTDDPGVDGGARWSPDGSRIAFYSFRQQAAGLMWVMDADGSEIQPVLEEYIPAGPEVACAGGFPGGWFPDGQRILYRGSQGGIKALQICSVATDGSDIKIILSEDEVFSYFPSLSPDGREIAFTSDRDGNLEIFVMNVDGGRLRRLTDDPGRDEYPTWSSDGQWIAFHSERDGDFDIYIMRPNGSDLRQLTDNDDNDTQSSWSPQ